MKSGLNGLSKIHLKKSYQADHDSVKIISKQLTPFDL